MIHFSLPLSPFGSFNSPFRLLEIFFVLNSNQYLPLAVQPQIAVPGYSLLSLVVESKVTFADNPPELLRAYVDSGEGIDK